MYNLVMIRVHNKCLFNKQNCLLRNHQATTPKIGGPKLHGSLRYFGDPSPTHSKLVSGLS